MEGTYSSVCPMTSPCYCISNNIVKCSLLRLAKLPQVLTFKQNWPEIDLTENFLKTLPENAFNGMRVVRLNLSRNTIEKIHVNAFVDVIRIDELDLSHNYLSTLPKGVFTPMPELRVLRMRYNRFVTMALGTFASLTRLVELDLTGNKLVKVPTSALGQLKSLRHLSLRGNAVTRIEAFAFNKLPLKYLDLGDNANNLHVTAEAFCGLEPHVSHTEPGVTDWIGIDSIKLDFNGITTLNPCIMAILWTLNTVDLSGNPLHCDCDSMLLRRLETHADFPGAQCNSPPELAGQYLQTINMDKFACPANRTHLLADRTSCLSLCPAGPPPGTRINRGALSSYTASLHRTCTYIYTLVSPILSLLCVFIYIHVTWWCNV